MNVRHGGQHNADVHNPSLCVQRQFRQPEQRIRENRRCHNSDQRPDEQIPAVSARVGHLGDDESALNLDFDLVYLVNKYANIRKYLRKYWRTPFRRERTTGAVPPRRCRCVTKWPRQSSIGTTMWTEPAAESPRWTIASYPCDSYMIFKCNIQIQFILIDQQSPNAVYYIQRNVAIPIDKLSFTCRCCLWWTDGCSAHRTRTGIPRMLVQAPRQREVCIATFPGRKAMWWTVLL